MHQLSSGFQRIIKRIPKRSRVLDVGGGGLDGANTTNFLRERFSDITLIEIATGRMHDYVKKFGDENIRQMIHDDFYKRKWGRDKFDLIVLDLNIENNIKRDWTSAGLKRIHRLLNPNGIVIIYVMTTYEYGDAEIPSMICKHMNIFWESVPPTTTGIRRKLKRDFADLYDVFSIVKEEIRDTIIWVALKKHGDDQ